MNIAIDKVTDAAYIRFNEGTISTTQEYGENVLIDLDTENKIVGIEILNFSKNNIDLKNLENNIKNGVPVEISNSTPVLA